MKVYIAMRYGYDGDFIEGVYATKELAANRVGELNVVDPASGVGASLGVEEHEVIA